MRLLYEYAFLTMRWVQYIRNLYIQETATIPFLSDTQHKTTLEVFLHQGKLSLCVAPESGRVGTWSLLA